MPLREYECDACHHRFEVIQKHADLPIDRCPKCGAPVHKLQSAPAFQFKGTGWYVTDYPKKGSGDASTKGDAGDKSEASGDVKSDAKSDAKTETKSDAKSEAKESSGKSEKPSASAKPASSTGSGASSSSTPKGS